MIYMIQPILVEEGEYEVLHSEETFTFLNSHKVNLTCSLYYRGGFSVHHMSLVYLSTAMERYVPFVTSVFLFLLTGAFYKVNGQYRNKGVRRY